MHTYPQKIFLLLITVSVIFIPVHACAHELEEAIADHTSETYFQHDSDNDSSPCEKCFCLSSHVIYVAKNISFSTNSIRTNVNLSYQKEDYLSIDASPPFKPPIT